jgi:hypothetical protein
MTTELSHVNCLADFMDQALNRCRVNGNSLRNIARVARIAPGTLSLIRHGRQGLPLARIPATAAALGLSEAEKEQFVLLVRSSQAKRAVQRGTCYVDEIESKLARARTVIADLMAWATGSRQQVPRPLCGEVHEVLGITSAVAPQPMRYLPNAYADARPFAEKPLFDSSDRDRLEARNDNGRPIPIEYRIRIRDSEGLLMHGDIVVVAGVNTVVEDVKRRYVDAELGEWPPGWYVCEIIRKSLPDAVLCVAIKIAKNTRNRHATNR